jgi:hypothetical protein
MDKDGMSIIASDKTKSFSDIIKFNDSFHSTFTPYNLEYKKDKTKSLLESKKNDYNSYNFFERQILFLSNTEHSVHVHRPDVEARYIE